MIAISGIKMPSPCAMQAELISIGSEEQRSASGRLVCDRVAVKRRLKLQWAALSGADLRKLLCAADGFFTAEYPDPLSGETRETVFYASACKMNALRMNAGGAVWTDIGMEWTEQ